MPPIAAPDVPEFTKAGNRYSAHDAAPKVTVVIPVFNTEKYLAQCLDSVINQTLRDIEIICIDDGSTDGSLNILLDYAGRDDRITVVSQKNQGLSAVRNRGITEAKGEYVQFLDSDDMLVPTALENLYAFASENRLDMLFFNARIKNIGGEHGTHAYDLISGISDVLTGDELFAKLREKGHYQTSACMYIVRLDYLRGIDLRFEEGVLHEDVLFTFICLLKAKRAAKLDEQYYIRCYRPGSIMTSPRSFDNLYGALRALIGMTLFAENHLCDITTMCAVKGWLAQTSHTIRRRYFNLPPSDVKRLKLLTPIEEFWLELATESEANMRIHAITSSLSYRVGMAITWLPRKIYDGICRLQRK